MEKSEYVDRAAVREKVCTGCTMWVDGVCCDADPCEDLVAGFLEAPSADVAPVQHGKWILRGKKILCSCCNAVFEEVDEKDLFEVNADLPYLCGMEKYCFNCGAKMDLEEKHDNN